MAELEQERREQFNIRTSFLSDEAYQYLLQLSQTKQLSAQVARWAEEHIKGSNQSNNEQNDMKDVLQELKEIKSMLLRPSLNHSFVTSPLIEKASPITLISSDKANTTIEDDDVNYNY